MMAQQPGRIIVVDPGAYSSSVDKHYAFFYVLGNYSSDMAIQVRQELKANDEQVEIKILFEVREQLKPDFANWDKLDKSRKRKLELAYSYVWKHLLELWEIDETILKEYKSELEEYGYHTPSAIYGLKLTPYGTGILYQEFHKEFVALLKNTKNAATISNCCNMMINEIYQMSWRPQHREKFRSLERLELLESPNCWDLFREKQEALQMEPLTEHTAMGIILLKEAFRYQRAHENQQNDPSAWRNASTMYGPPSPSYLFNIEKKMMEPPPNLRMLSYRDEIKKMLEQQ